VTHSAERLAEWSTTLSFEEIPPEVVEAAKLHLLDALGTGLAALGVREVPAVLETGLELGGRPQATALGLTKRVPAAVAALVNGTLMHALDFDDTHDRALVHSSAVVTPTVLACGEATEAKGRDVLAAAVAAFEISARSGLAAPGRFHARGFHATSICGVFAAAAAAAKLRSLSPAQATSALGIAGSQAAGLMEFLADGSQTKPFHAGWAAHSGIIAASLAAHGASGPASVLEGRFGLLRSHLEEGAFDEGELVAGLGDQWETLHIAFKPYPVCHLSHTCLDSLAGLVAEEGLEAVDIREVLCRVGGEIAVEVVLEPRERKLRPANPYEAKFSLPYCLAALLVRGNLGVANFTEDAICDEGVLALARRVRYERVQFAGGNEFSGEVLVEMNDGRRLERRMLFARGGSDNPMAAADIEHKFRLNAALGLRDDSVERLLEIVRGLESCETSELSPLLAQARAGDRVSST
jgi:2-methylcitrate dehydratase PrpD